MYGDVWWLVESVYSRIRLCGVREEDRGTTFYDPLCSCGVVPPQPPVGTVGLLLLFRALLSVAVEPVAPTTPARTVSGAPKLVCRRSNDPNTRLPFDSSELLDARDAVLESIQGGGTFVFTSVWVCSLHKSYTQLLHMMLHRRIVSQGEYTIEC